MNKYGWLLLAALCGALVSLRLEKTAQTLIQKFTFILCGMAFAFFLTPLITAHWHLQEPGQIAAIGFFMSMMWQNIYNRFARGIEEAELPLARKPESVEILEKVEEIEEARKGEEK